MQEIVISKLKSVGKGNLLGTASVQIGPVTVNQCRIIQAEDKPLFVGMPQEGFMAGGKRVFLPLVKLEPNLHEAVQSAVLRAWEERTNDPS